MIIKRKIYIQLNIKKVSGLIRPHEKSKYSSLRRKDACRAKKALKKLYLHGKKISLTWAPGKGVMVRIFYDKFLSGSAYGTAAQSSSYINTLHTIPTILLFKLFFPGKRVFRAKHLVSVCLSVTQSVY